MAKGHQIFISYKFSDTNVKQDVQHQLFESSDRMYGKRTPRDYVNILETFIENHSPHYYKGEKDGESLKGKSEEFIWEHLKDMIFDSTLTIVLISPNMKTNEPENEQWIPWEIHYSLMHKTRHSETGKDVCSATNAMMAIVLPDRNGNYEYYFENKKCCKTGCRLNKTNSLFRILKNNTFNRKTDENTYSCDVGDKIYSGNMHSFISFYKWKDIDNPDKLKNAINLAYKILSEKEKYKVRVEI